MDIQKIRLDRKMTQQQVADAAGIKQPSYANIERGRQPSVKVAKAIAEVLNFDWTLFYEEG